MFSDLDLYVFLFAFKCVVCPVDCILLSLVTITTFEINITIWKKCRSDVTLWSLYGGEMTHFLEVCSIFQGGEGIMMTGQNSGFAGPRNVASNAFLRQSPSPSALQASPAGLGATPSRYDCVLAKKVSYFVSYCIFLNLKYIFCPMFHVSGI